MTAPPRRTGIRDTDPPDPPAELLARYGARVLDPATAPKMPDAAERESPGSGRYSVPPRRTVYVADQLVVPFSLAGTVVERLAAGEAGNARGRRDEGDDDLVNRFEALEPEGRAIEPVVTVHLDSADPGDPPPDAWSVLLKLQDAGRRRRAGDTAQDDLARVELQRLLFATNPWLEGTPGTQGFAGDDATSRRRGPGGRQPVQVLRGDHDLVDTDVTVAVLDTGLGQHDLFADRVVPLPQDIHFVPPAEDPELDGDLIGRYDGELDRCAGHGTHIAGIVRQLCPSATIMPIRVMRSDGIALQQDVANALAALLNLRKTRNSGVPHTAVHIVVISMGYWDEQATVDAAGNPTGHHGQIYDLIRQLGEQGVAVVAAAGNEATSLPFYPAAFAAEPPESGVVPVLSVGALNLDGSVALFSNSGPWVRYWRNGVNVVSTFPTTFNGGLAPVVSTSDPIRPPRRGFDPDNFGSGWGIWFGSSFSGPIVAGQLAALLVAGANTQRIEANLVTAMTDAIGGLADADPAEAAALEEPEP